MSKVSIIVPIYKSEAFVERCIRSLMGQTHADIEIIAVNDGSPDNSGAILEGLAAQDARIRLITQENQGVCQARNNGIDAATGEYLLFVDGDDYVDPDYVETLLTAAQHNNSDLVISGYKIEDAATGKQQDVMPTGYKANEDEMWAYRIMGVMARLYRRSFWDGSKLRFTSEPNVRGEDVPICLCANYLARNIALANTAGYHYVQHEGSAMAQFTGLKNFTFPKEAFEDVAALLSTEQEHNGRDFLVYGILKTFAQFSYQLAKGADRNTKEELNDYFINYVKTTIPDYLACWRKAKRGSLPFYIRVAVWLFVMKVKF